MPPIERGLIRIAPWLLAGVLASLPLLFVVPTDNPLTLFTIQISVLAVYSLALTLVLMPLGDEAWFVGTTWRNGVRLAASGASLVVLVTGIIGLVTLASSAALGFSASLQYLQLLSALDIAWIAAATMIGAYRIGGRLWAIVAGSIVAVVCVWSIWNYLDIVGFRSDGGWIGFGPDLLVYVIPLDVVAALVAIGVFFLGVRAQAHPTEQPSPQS